MGRSAEHCVDERLTYAAKDREGWLRWRHFGGCLVLVVRRILLSFFACLCVFEGAVKKEAW